ncbi:ATP-binding protein [Nocardiopsis mangrovi]|uniref:ATP-binding protein n=1 Tax=Nocardiopsis mangrovi TaxID=1179818 RepID=A0ABV9DQK2_9ACTN
MTDTPAARSQHGAHTAGPSQRPGGRSLPAERPARSTEERRRPAPDVLGPPVRRRFPGLAHQIQHARRFVARALGPGPDITTATLLTSELATNAITHSASGSPGGKFEVTVYCAEGWSRVEVRDLGSPEQPRPQHRDPHDVSEHGRGLDLVEALAAKWGTEPRGDGLGRMVWFELAWEAGPAPGDDRG